MRQRTPGSGRPSGTDGSDFSYRMVVDSRYQKVAKGKSRLSAFFLVQAVIHVVGVLYRFLLTPWQEELPKIVISSLAIGLVFLTIGELGRRRSRASLLKLYMVGSSITTCVILALLALGNFSLEGIKLRGNGAASKFERLETSRFLLGLLFQVLTLSTTASLIRNMSPPKKTS